MKKLLVIISLFPCLAFAQTSEDFVIKANEQANHAHYQEAIANFTIAIKLNNGYTKAYLYRGNAYTNTKQYDEAIADFTQVLNAEPKNATVYTYRANAYSNVQKYPEAISDFSKAIEFGKNDASIYHYRANAQLNSKHYAEAIADFTKAIEISPRDTALYAFYEYRGIAKAQIDDDGKAQVDKDVRAQQVKDNESAIDDYTTSLKLRPQNYDVYFYRANSEGTVLRYADAKADYTTTIEHQPRNAHAYFYRGNIETNLREYQTSVKDYRAALDMDPTIPEGNFYLAKAASNADDNLLAISYFNKALIIDPKNKELYLYRGISEGKLDDSLSAMKDFTETVTLDPNYSRGYQNRGDLEISMGSNNKDYYKTALADGELAVKYVGANTDGYAYVTRGKAKTALQDTLGALADYNNAIKLNPINSEAYTGRGLVESMQTEYIKALADLNKAIELYAANSYAYSVRGQVNSILGDRKAAISDFRMQLKFDHRNTEGQLRLIKELNADHQYSEALVVVNMAIDTLTKRAKPADSTKFAKFYMQRGITKSNLADSAGARADFRKSMATVQGMTSTAYSNIAEDYGRYKQFKQDSLYIEKAISKDQNNDEAYFLRAGLKMRAKNYLGADYDYISVLLINPDAIKTYRNRGLAESYLMDTANMRLDFNRAIKVSPKDGNNYVFRARAKMVLKDYAGAMRDFDKAIELDKENAEALYYMGVAKLDQNNTSGCADLKKALTLGYKDAAEVIKLRCGRL